MFGTASATFYLIVWYIVRLVCIYINNKDAYEPSEWDVDEALDGSDSFNFPVGFYFLFVLQLGFDVHGVWSFHDITDQSSLAYILADSNRGGEGVLSSLSSVPEESNKDQWEYLACVQLLLSEVSSGFGV